VHKIASRWVVLSIAAVAGAVATGTWASRSPTPVPVSMAVAWWMGGEYKGREGVVMQSGGADCGVAALAMVLEHHRRDAGLDEVRRGVLGRGEGLTLLEMQHISARHGLPAQGWRMDMPALARAPLPAVVHFEDHYVVVDRVLPDGTVHLRDPGIGRVVLPAADFARHWTGNVLVFGG
jgi:ABC-type bacteriocin/lantibiotic exporter with double-glycine peptidase domain